MNDMIQASNGGLISATDKQALREVLRNSFYPGAADASIDMVLSYCTAGGYDPMTKPVYIVPMWDRSTKSMRDAIMPGIGLYRIIADRTGKYAGQDDAEFGPEMENWGIRFPLWCKVTIYKISPAGRVPYSAKVFWLEAYSTASKDSDAPNAMWKKRPYGQLEKCAEAAVLRKAFPEIGVQPTAEEMEGKIIDLSPSHDSAETTGPTPKSRTEALKSKINESLIKAGAMPAIIPDEPPAGMNPETGEIPPPDIGVDALLAAIAACNSPADVKELAKDASHLSDSEKDQVRQAMRARIAELKGAT